MSKKRYLIFGNGFIATHYARFLLKDGASVCIAFRSKKNPELPRVIQKKSASNLKAVSRLLRNNKPNYIILTQGISFIPDNERELRDSVSSNVIAPLMVLEAVYRLRQSGELAGLRKILTFGSAAEYGASDKEKWSEKISDTHPHSLYGLVKHWLSQVSHFYAELGLPTVHLRHFNTTGAGQDTRFVISSFCHQIAIAEKKNGMPRLVVGDLSQKRDFIDIRDAIRAYELSLRSAPRGSVINICTGKAYSIKEITELLRRMTDHRFRIVVDKRLFAPRRTRDKTLVGSPTWLSKQGWKPEFTLSQTVGWVLQDWREKIKTEK